MDMKKKRNVILVGHAQAGKTSLAEAMLFFCKATSRKGKIEDGTTVSDYSFDEIATKHSINVSLLYCEYKGTRIQIIDTPGYADFYGEVLAGVRAADAAVIVVDAVSGVEVGTERAWQVIEEANIPAFVFVNKTDKPDVDTDAVIETLRNKLSRACVVVSEQSQELQEVIAESDDRLLEKFLDGTQLDPDEVARAVPHAVASRRVVPIICGSAHADRGIGDLLDAIVNYGPDPSQRAVVALDPGHPGQQVEVAGTSDGDFASFVFKNISDPYVGQLTLLRVFRGSLASNTGFYNATKKTRERIGQIYLLQGKEQRSLDIATAGDIIAIAKLKEAALSDSLTSDKAAVVFPPIVFPEPALSASVKPKSREDEEKISIALHKLAAEDPTFRVTHDPQTKELIISGLGDLHLDVMVHRLKKRFNVSVELGTPKVSYKETITKGAKVQGKFKRQSGGRGQYGDVWIEVQPLERGKGFEFVDKIVGGAIPRNFIPSVEKGVRQACVEGAVAGYPIEDIRVILYDGSYHDVDSSDMAFQIAGAMALRKAVAAAGPVLLEPIMEIEVTIPEESLGAISGDINARRGHVVGMEIKGRQQIVKAQAPLAEIFKYANDLRSMTAGRGTYRMQYSHYAEVPHKISAPIITQYLATRKHEEE
jgi:elongation factor G